MSWELYIPKRKGMPPCVKIYNDGRAYLSKAVLDKFNKERLPFINIYTDKRNKQIAIEFIGEYGSSSRSLHFGKDKQGAFFNIGNVIKYIDGRLPIANFFFEPRFEDGLLVIYSRSSTKEM